MLDERGDVEFQIIAGELCLDFVNTLDNRPLPDRRKELLVTFQDLADWAVQAGALSPLQRTSLLREAGIHPKAAEQALGKAIALRECLYRIISSILRNRRAASDDLVAFNGYQGEALSNLQLKPAAAAFAWVGRRSLRGSTQFCGQSCGRRAICSRRRISKTCMNAICPPAAGFSSTAARTTGAAGAT